MRAPGPLPALRRRLWDAPDYARPAGLPISDMAHVPPCARPPRRPPGARLLCARPGRSQTAPSTPRQSCQTSVQEALTCGLPSNRSRRRRCSASARPWGTRHRPRPENEARFAADRVRDGVVHGRKGVDEAMGPGGTRPLQHGDGRPGRHPTPWNSGSTLQPVSHTWWPRHSRAQKADRSGRDPVGPYDDGEHAARPEYSGWR